MELTRVPHRAPIQASLSAYEKGVGTKVSDVSEWEDYLKINSNSYIL